ncbi:MAG: FAD-dependent oxidoreductase [Actinobacteria bacterium]|nr:FAD-dependent oxidoreductase [Actinomycetota bacterium]
MSYDLVIVGMGSGGLVAGEFAASLGLRVAAVERSRVGGDCLWTGCVPSKALLASAKIAHHLRTADRFGIAAVEPDVDLAAVWRRIREIQRQIAETDDNPARYEAMGIEVVRGEARLEGAKTVAIGGRVLETRYILLCTGSRPATPSLPGLEEAGFLTSENVFELESPPRSIVILGGGPIGVELAQGMNRLGIRVTLLQKGDRLLPRDEPELAELLTSVLLEEGVDVRLAFEASRVERRGSLKAVESSKGEGFEVDEILVATGRTPTTDGLGLEKAGVAVGRRGIEVDGRMRTNVSSIYAVGDVAGRYHFTHSAGHEGAMAVRDMFFPGKGKVSDLVPWTTFTDPELAHVGLTVAEARERHGTKEVAVERADLSHSDRARADGTTSGRIVLITARDKLVGAHILAPGAGELIHEPALAIREGMKLRELASLIHVYPTMTTSINLLAAEAAYRYAGRFGWLTRFARLAR